jgi:hypothetical protein
MAATLDMVKAIKELESIDITHLKELVAIATALKGQEQITATAEESKVAPKNTQKAQNGSGL